MITEQQELISIVPYILIFSFFTICWLFIVVDCVCFVCAEIKYDKIHKKLKNNLNM